MDWNLNFDFLRELIRFAVDTNYHTRETYSLHQTYSLHYPPINMIYLWRKQKRKCVRKIFIIWSNIDYCYIDKCSQWMSRQKTAKTDNIDIKKALIFIILGNKANYVLPLTFSIVHHNFWQNLYIKFMWLLEARYKFIYSLWEFIIITFIY